MYVCIHQTINHTYEHKPQQKITLPHEQNYILCTNSNSNKQFKMCKGTFVAFRSNLIHSAHYFKLSQYIK